MKRIITIVLLLCISVMVMGARKAIVMGNASYQDSPLRNPINDANLMAGVLRDLGFQVRTVLDADQHGMEIGFDEFVASIDWQDEVVFYYSGHGVNAYGENYLIPTGRVIKDEVEIKYHAFSCNLALEKLQKARISVMILDACRDNPFKGARSTNKGLATMNGKAGSQYIIYSTELGKTAADGLDSNSPFTSILVKHIRSGEKITDMMQKVTREVKAFTNDRQIPWTAGNLIEDFYFANPKKAAKPNPEPESSSAAAGILPGFLVGKWINYRGFNGYFEFIPMDQKAIMMVVSEYSRLNYEITSIQLDSGMYRLSTRDLETKKDTYLIIKHTHPGWISIYSSDVYAIEGPDDPKEYIDLYTLGPEGDTIPPLKFEFPEYLLGEWFDKQNGSWNLSVERTEWGVKIRYGSVEYSVRSVSQVGSYHWVFCEELEDDVYLVLETVDYNEGSILVTVRSDEGKMADSMLYFKRDPSDFMQDFTTCEGLPGKLEWGWENRESKEKIVFWNAYDSSPALVHFYDEYVDYDSTHFKHLLRYNEYLIVRTEVSGNNYRITARAEEDKSVVSFFVMYISKDRIFLNVTPGLTDYPWGPYYEMEGFPIGG